MPIYEAIERLRSMRLIFVLQSETTKAKKREVEINKDLEALNIAISTLEQIIQEGNNESTHT